MSFLRWSLLSRAYGDLCRRTYWTQCPGIGGTVTLLCVECNLQSHQALEAIESVMRNSGLILLLADSQPRVWHVVDLDYSSLQGNFNRAQLAAAVNSNERRIVFAIQVDVTFD